jgi:hypothetical protein
MPGDGKIRAVPREQSYMGSLDSEMDSVRPIGRTPFVGSNARPNGNATSKAQPRRVSLPRRKGCLSQTDMSRGGLGRAGGSAN